MNQQTIRILHPSRNPEYWQIKIDNHKQDYLSSKQKQKEENIKGKIEGTPRTVQPAIREETIHTGFI